MPGEFLTLLDIANRSGSDQVVGIVEEGIIVVPELGVLSGRTIRGTSYKMMLRTKRPSAGFRGANEGVDPGSGRYSPKIVECYILDAQMQVDKAVADADEFGRDALLADEADAQTTGAMEAWSNQFYYGQNSDTDKGFDGLANLIPLSMTVNAGGGAGNDKTSVYLIWNDVKGVYPIFGNDGAIEMNDAWQVQQVTDANGKVYSAYVNGLTAWVGLQHHVEAASRIANIDDTNKLTDKLIAQAIKLHPRSKRPNVILMNRRAAFQLQESRSAITGVRSGSKSRTGQEVWAPEPTESNGVSLVITDAISDTEAQVAFS